MTDIIERLCKAKDPFWYHTRDDLIAEAADEIERLRADLKSRRENWGGYSVDEVKRIVADEREACINIAENVVLGPNHTRDLIVAAIRGRKDD